MKTILLISQYKFPEGDAGSVRFYNMALSLQTLGYRVIVIGLGNEGTPFNELLYKGIKYYTLRSANKYSTYFLFLFRVMKMLRNIKNKMSVDSIILGTSFPDVLLGLQIYCSFYKILLVKDVVEWYSSKQFKLGIFSFQYILKNLENKYFLMKRTRIISISHYLYTSFSKRGFFTVRIPIFFNMKEAQSCIKKYDGKLQIVYAGSPGKKDYLDAFLNGLFLFDDFEISQIRVVIVGVDDRALRALVADKVYSKVSSVLLIMGKRKREETLNIIAQSNFSVFLRDSDARYAKAGFPTKSIESFFCGTPIICNISSDLGDFLIDGKNSFIVKSLKESDVAYTLRRALKLTPQEIQEMSHNAKMICGEKFDIISYQNEFVQLLSV